jgi:hypothetical protein
MTQRECEKVLSVLQVSANTTIPDRFIKVFQYTSFSFRGLLGKYLRWEEASIETAKFVQKEIAILMGPGTRILFHKINQGRLRLKMLGKF